MRDDYLTIADRARELAYACGYGGPAAHSAAVDALQDAWRAGFVAGSKRPARESWLEWMVRLAKGRAS